MFGSSSPFKTCRVCLLALAVPLAYISLAASGIVTSAEPRAQSDAEVKQEANDPVQRQVDALVKSHLELQNLLADDQMDGVGNRLSEIHKKAKELTDAKDQKVAAQAKTVAKHASAEPENLKEARKALESLSAAVIGLVQLVPPSSEVAPALYEATCPMAKANWLQTTKELKNPYMGRAMLKCGSIERTIKQPAPGTENAASAAAAGCAASSCCAAGR